MNTAHFTHWPSHSATTLTAPATNLFFNAEVNARRYPDKPFLVFYDSIVTFSQFEREARKVAGFLEQRCGVKKGDRVLLLMQNSPQFVIAYYGILRANAVVVPLNPMNRSTELVGFVRDCDAKTAIVSQELFANIEPLLESGALTHALVAAYSDALTTKTSLAIPEFVSAPRAPITRPGVTAWAEVIAAALEPGPLTVGPDELSVMPYTSGTTGAPKGCMHTHRSLMHTAVASMQWFGLGADITLLAVAPFFHVTGMQGCMNGPLYLGNTVVLLPRWDRAAAAQCVERYAVGAWTAIPTMIQDFFANPELPKYNLRSIRILCGGGSAMPAAVAQRLMDIGLPYVEGYGLSETAAATHLNPREHLKKQCLGIPIFNVDSRVIDPTTLKELGVNEIGEIVSSGPQVFQGYWGKPEDTAQAFVELDGKRFFRTGDLGRVDEDGYFFMVDRLKRMINASGYKVWPAEVESLMYQHPSVQEACVIGAKDEHRGETVKAVIVLRPGFKEKVTAQELIDWSREIMASYKAPRVIEFAESLPKSGAGKIMWRELQAREDAQ